MAKAPKKTYYWDSSCFITWITGKGWPREVIDGLDDIAKEITENRARLCTSVVTETEILEGHLTPEQITKLQDLFKRRNVIQISLDHRISRKASDIRNHYHKKGIKIETADSQHLATAILYEVDELDTLDGAGKRQRPSDLLRLNGDVAGHHLHIRMPFAEPPPLCKGEPLIIENVGAQDGGAIAETKKSVEPSPAEIQGSGQRHIEGQTVEGKTEDVDKAGKIEGPPSL